MCNVVTLAYRSNLDLMLFSILMLVPYLILEVEEGEKRKSGHANMYYICLYWSMRFYARDWKSPSRALYMGDAQDIRHGRMVCLAL